MKLNSEKYTEKGGMIPLPVGKAEGMMKFGQMIEAVLSDLVTLRDAIGTTPPCPDVWMEGVERRLDTRGDDIAALRQRVEILEGHMQDIDSLDIVRHQEWHGRDLRRHAERLKVLEEKKVQADVRMGPQCPKCLSMVIHTQYHDGRGIACFLGEQAEHLHRHCRFCGYSWDDPCADQAGGER